MARQEKPKLTRPSPTPPVPMPAVAPGLIDPAKEQFLADHKARYDAALVKKAAADAEIAAAVAIPEVAKLLSKRWRCRVCEQQFDSVEARPACKFGCIYPVEKRHGPQGELTTEMVRA